MLSKTQKWGRHLNLIICAHGVPSFPALLGIASSLDCIFTLSYFLGIQLHLNKSDTTSLDGGYNQILSWFE